MMWRGAKGKEAGGNRSINGALHVGMLNLETGGNWTIPWLGGREEIYLRSPIPQGRRDRGLKRREMPGPDP